MLQIDMQQLTSVAVECNFEYACMLAWLCSMSFVSVSHDVYEDSLEIVIVKAQCRQLQVVTGTIPCA